MFSNYIFNLYIYKGFGIEMADNGCAKKPNKSNYIYLLYMYRTLAWWLECSTMVQETGAQSEVASYQRLKKWYMMPPFLTLSIIRYGSRVKYSNPEKDVAPSPTPSCSRYWKGILQITLDYCRQLYFFYVCIKRIRH